jgi:hypothetical protein
MGHRNPPRKRYFRAGRRERGEKKPSLQGQAGLRL